MSIRFYQLFFSLLLILVLSGCGFQPRSAHQILPFHTVSLETSTPYSNFTKALREALEAIDVNTTPPTPSLIKLQILSQTFTQTITSLGKAGQTTTYLLAYTILFQVLDNTGRILLAPQQIRTTRNFSITSNQLSGDLNTQHDLEESMQRDAIQQLITRLASPALRQLYCRITPHHDGNLS